MIATAEPLTKTFGLHDPTTVVGGELHVPNVVEPRNATGNGILVHAKNDS